jgi:hypothetical protein
VSEDVSAAKNATSWYQLGDLYSSIEEPDVRRGLLEYRVASHPKTKEAKIAELASDYERAFVIYVECLDGQMDNCNDLEVGALVSGRSASRRFTDI